MYNLNFKIPSYFLFILEQVDNLLESERGKNEHYFTVSITFLI